MPPPRNRPTSAAAIRSSRVSAVIAVSIAPRTSEGNIQAALGGMKLSIMNAGLRITQWAKSAALTASSRPTCLSNTSATNAFRPSR